MRKYPSPRSRRRRFTVRKDAVHPGAPAFLAETNA
jgi:hypothetical protein